MSLVTLVVAYVAVGLYVGVADAVANLPRIRRTIAKGQEADVASRGPNRHDRTVRTVGLAIVVIVTVLLSVLAWPLDVLRALRVEAERRAEKEFDDCASRH